MTASYKWHRASVRQTMLVLFLGTCAIPAPSTADPIDVHGFLSLQSFESTDTPSGAPEHLHQITLSARRAASAPGGSAPIVFEVVVPAQQAAGALEITRSPLPATLGAGSLFDVSTHVAWTGGFLLDFDCCPEFPFTLPPSTGTMVITGGQARLEDGGDEWLSGSAPFMFDALIDAFDPATGAVLFQREIRGQGTAHVLVNADDPRYYSYAFQIESIPEPGTLVLLGLGGAGLAVRRRIRRL